MLCYTLSGYRIPLSAAGYGEVPDHVHIGDFESAYEAINACLNPSQAVGAMPSYVVVHYRNGTGSFATIDPKEAWGSWEKFAELLQTHILATQIQLNFEMSQDRATEELIVRAVDNKRLSH
ncbi:hypothetical protein LUCX_243 [Xanthomonas phage vB_XciM_LucasX]|nr:hypothetical protein LUCX_243 [Xanthomonas phage vB_XciM_LucasX]